MVASFVATRRRRRTATLSRLATPDLVATTEVLHFHDRLFVVKLGSCSAAALTSMQWDKQPCGGHILRLAVYSGFLGEAAIARLRAGYARAVASLIRLQPSYVSRKTAA